MGPWVTASWGAEGPRYLLDDEEEEKGEGKKGPREDAELQVKARNRLRLASPPRGLQEPQVGHRVCPQMALARPWLCPGTGQTSGHDGEAQVPSQQCLGSGPLGWLSVPENRAQRSPPPSTVPRGMEPEPSTGEVRQSHRGWSSSSPASAPFWTQPRAGTGQVAQ